MITFYTCLFLIPKQKTNRFFCYILTCADGNNSSYVRNSCSNVELSKTQESSFLDEASRTVATSLSKPETYVCVSYTQCNMRFGGTDDPCAYVQLESLGNINKSCNGKYASDITSLVAKHTGVKPERIYMKLQVCITPQYM